MKTIHFEWGSEKQIKIAQAGQKDTFFYEAYRQALAGVTEIVRASMIAVDKQEYDPFASSEGAGSGRERSPALLDDKYFYNYPNNMLVFSGDRGAGKSSAMLSFVYSLQNPDSKLYDKSFLMEMIARELPGIDYYSVSSMLRGAQFISLPPIDPTTLENSDQILTVILARMFQMAIDAWNGREMMPPRAQEQERLNRKNELIKQFSTCYEHIRAIKKQDGEGSEYEGLDVLADLRDNSRLKCELADLVEQLLKFKCVGSPKEPYLIIQIDDTDMNIQHAYSILEDIRKYLVIPRVIIVMAANLTHLKQVIESSLLGDYHEKLRKSPEYANHIARQYMTKLFPQTRQINLPELGTYFKEHADSIGIQYHVMGRQVLPDKDWPSLDVQEQIFRLIYRKTGLIFLKDKNRLHYIIPTNMRLHAHFLAMLIQMEDVENPDVGTPGFFLDTPSDGDGLCKHKKMLNTRLENILRFRDYFLSTWVTNNLSEKYAELIKTLDHTDVSRKVRFVCRHLWNMYVQTLAETDDEDCELKEAQCSYANMILLCRHFEAVSAEESDSRFIFAIRMYFSLLGHSIVLEELIDFYQPMKDSAVSGLRCSLSRLYSLYGSRIFPYSDQLEWTDQNQYYTEISTTGVDERIYQLISCWRGRAGGTLTDFRVKDTVSLLYSMFADYLPVGPKAILQLDLCSPITNCLYLHKLEYLEMSPLAKTMWDGGALGNSLKIEDESWITMRNSALLTILNWDVQNQVGQTLLSLAKPTETIYNDYLKLRISYEEWPEKVKAFYVALSDPLHSPEGVRPAIAALDQIEFDGWFELPIFSGGEGSKEDILNVDEWYDAMNNLNPYIECPEVKVPEAPANGGGENPGEPPEAKPEPEVLKEDEQGTEKETVSAPPALESKSEETVPEEERPAEDDKLGDIEKD